MYLPLGLHPSPLGPLACIWPFSGFSSALGENHIIQLDIVSVTRIQNHKMLDLIRLISFFFSLDSPTKINVTKELVDLNQSLRQKNTDLKSFVRTISETINVKLKVKVQENEKILWNAESKKMLPTTYETSTTRER